MNPRARFCVGRKYSQFWPILASFVDYYSLFWVSERFPRSTNPEVRLRVGHQHSQFLAESDPFHGLLLIVLGARSNFHD